MCGRKVKNKSGQPEHFIITFSGNQADRQWAIASQVIYHEAWGKLGNITNSPSNSIWSLSQTDSLLSVWGTNTRWGPEVWSIAPAHGGLPHSLCVTSSERDCGWRARKRPKSVFPWAHRLQRTVLDVVVHPVHRWDWHLARLTNCVCFYIIHDILSNKEDV